MFIERSVITDAVFAVGGQKEAVATPTLKAADRIEAFMLAAAVLCQAFVDV